MSYSSCASLFLGSSKYARTVYTQIGLDKLFIVIKVMYNVLKILNRFISEKRFH